MEALDKDLVAQIWPVGVWCAKCTRPKLPVPKIGPNLKSVNLQFSSHTCEVPHIAPTSITQMCPESHPRPTPNAPPKQTTITMYLFLRRRISSLARVRRPLRFGKQPPKHDVTLRQPRNAPNSHDDLQRRQRPSWTSAANSMPSNGNRGTAKLIIALGGTESRRDAMSTDGPTHLCSKERGQDSEATVVHLRWSESATTSSCMEACSAAAWLNSCEDGAVRADWVMSWTGWAARPYDVCPESSASARCNRPRVTRPALWRIPGNTTARLTVKSACCCTLCSSARIALPCVNVRVLGFLFFKDVVFLTIPIGWALPCGGGSFHRCAHRVLNIARSLFNRFHTYAFWRLLDVVLGLLLGWVFHTLFL